MSDTPTKRRIKKTPSKLDTELMVITKAEAQITSNALDIEDGFKNLYNNGIITPEIAPDVYYGLVEENNTLGQCISAMEVNIDGTGYEIVRTDGEEISDTEKKDVEKIESFLTEVYPEVFLTTMRRRLRRHAETSGYGCMEVVRNPKGDIVFMRDLDSKTIRLRKLGDPVPVTKTLSRNGADMSITVQVRERTFVQIISNKKVFFKQFGSTRDLNKKTGVFSNGKLPSKDRATEILYYAINKSAKTAYGVPRWLNQLPSVIGSRSAEELNLEFFESGGIPPRMIFVSGGVMAETTKNNLNALLSGRAKDKLKGLVADIQSTGGTIDKAGSVSVKVESFGSEKQKDSMFENYDDKCEKRIRGSFRLPPVFMGKVDEYSYASVFASYTVAEAQVFAPERMEWDELFNNTVMKELTDGVYQIKSNPLTVVDAETNLKALELAIEGRVISASGLRGELNKIGTLDLKEIEKDDELVTAKEIVATPQPVAPKAPVKKSAVSVGDFAHLSDVALLQSKLLLATITKDEIVDLEKLLKNMSDSDKELVGMLTTTRIYNTIDNDVEGMVELCGCALANG